MATWLIALGAGAVGGLVVSVLVAVAVLRFVARQRSARVLVDYDEGVGRTVVPPAPSVLMARKLRLLQGINRRRRGRWEGWR